MSNQEIQFLILGFPSVFSAALWNFSEDSNLAIGEFAPFIFELMMGIPGHPVE